MADANDNDDDDADAGSEINKRIHLDKLTMNDIPTITKDQFMALTREDVAEDLKEWPRENIGLLRAIRVQAKSYFNAKHFLCQKLYKKLTTLEHGEKINAERREKRQEAAAADGKVFAPRKPKPENDPDAFEKEYSKAKYIKHPISTKQYDTTILQTHAGRVRMKVGFPTEEDVAELEGEGESGLYFANYYPVSSMSNKQKNDTVAIIGWGFGREHDEGFSHNDAGVAHAILSREYLCAGVMLVTYVPRPKDCEHAAQHTVCAAVFTHVHTTRHKQNGTRTKMQQGKLKAVNLVQIATLSQWGGRNLAGILMGHCVNEQLSKYDFDLMIICGCAEGFYSKKLSLECAPTWLETPPWNLDVPEGDDREQGAYNRDIFFFVPLTHKFHDNLQLAHSDIGDTFSFKFRDDQLVCYFGLNVVQQEQAEQEELADGLEGLAITEK